MDKTKSLKINIEQFSYTPSNPIFLKNKIEIGLGEIVGIVAPNGYGKSTLMDIIAGNIVSPNCEIQYSGLNAGMNINYKAIVTKMLEPMDLYENCSIFIFRDFVLSILLHRLSSKKCSFRTSIKFLC